MMPEILRKFIQRKEWPTMDKKDVFELIDHTILKSTASSKEILLGCDQLIQYGFASICVHPCNVILCYDYLAGRGKIATVAGFPFGTNTSSAKAFEAAEAVKNGADEIDMVINAAALKEGKYQYCVDDIKGVVESAAGHIVKVIIETSLLTDDEKKRACELIMKAGAHFVKTSTGYQGGGATIEDVRLLRSAAGESFGVKASGGIRTLEQCEELIAAGATRIGTGAAVKIALADTAE